MIKSTFIKLLFIIIFIAILRVGERLATAEDWPHYRGPRHDGISTETGFRTKWNPPPPVLWEKELGEAFSSFVCVGEKLFTCGAKNQQQVIYCLEAATGAVIWEKPFEPEMTDPDKNLYGTRATPTCDNGFVYLTGGHGRLMCLKADSGELIWERKLRGQPQWGYAGSVLIDGDLAIVEAGTEDGSLLALSKRDGKEIWKCGDARAGYATPYPFDFGGKRYICGFMADRILIADARTGRLEASLDWPSHSGVNASSPIFNNDHLFFSTGYGYGCGLYRLKRDGAALKLGEIWRSKALKNKFQTPILHEGYLYTSDERALKCVEFLTGKIAWLKGDAVMNKDFKHGTVLLADSWLFFLTESGELYLVKPSPKGFKPRAKAKILDGRCWTVPILVDGKLYARSLKKAVCLDMR